MVKWKILNGIAFFLLWAAITGSHYDILYPGPFTIGALLKLVAWQPFLLLYSALLLLAWTFSFIFWNKSSVQTVFFKTVFILQVIATITMVISGVSILNKKRNELSELLSDTKLQAAHDIHVDSVRFISYGLPLPDSNYIRRDSIMAKYGIYHTPICIIDPISETRDLYYERLTQNHLDKRNGKNWKKKMQKELELYK